MSETLTPFLHEEPFVTQNRAPIEGLFIKLAADFPDRVVTIEDETFATKDALQISDDDQLTPAAREWLGVHTVGTQHGYDRAGDRLQKIYIEPGDRGYMGLLGAINVGLHNFVEGGQADVTVANRNILVGGGFPHLASGRLRHALDDDYTRLDEAHTVAVLSGQRRRWNDNPNEDTSDKVIELVARGNGLDLASDSDRKYIEVWQAKSPFAKQQEAIRPLEGQDWKQPYATEAEMGRAAIELALMRADGLFDWNSYPVIEHPDEQAEPFDIEGYKVPARSVRAWEYQLENGKSLYVVNGAPVRRDRGGEPRPTSASVMAEACNLLADNVQHHESIVAFGAPHIRAGMHTASQLITTTGGNIKPVHLTNDRWEVHEPPVTGIASVLGTEGVDTGLRATLRNLDDAVAIPN